MSFWIAEDTLKKERLNRVAMAARLVSPLYDESDLGVTHVQAINPAPVLLDTSLTLVWSLPSGVAVVQVWCITITNTDSSNRAVSLYLIEPGASSISVARQIFADTLTPFETVTIRVPYFMAAQASIRGLASGANVVNVRVDALVYTNQPVAVNLDINEGVVLGTSLSTLYQCPTSGKEHAVLIALTLCNTDIVSRTPQIHLVPNGSSPSAATRIRVEEMVSKETIIIEEHYIMEPGDTLQALASAASVLSARPTAMELA